MIRLRFIFIKNVSKKVHAVASTLGEKKIKNLGLVCKTIVLFLATVKTFIFVSI